MRKKNHPDNRIKKDMEEWWLIYNGRYKTDFDIFYTVVSVKSLAAH